MLTKQPYFVYIVKCADDTLYTGIATELESRLAKHNQGQGAKYTRGRLPVRLVYVESQPDRSAALKREKQIKQKSRVHKLDLIKTNSITDNG